MLLTHNVVHIVYVSTFLLNDVTDMLHMFLNVDNNVVQNYRETIWIFSPYPFHFLIISGFRDRNF